MKKKAVALLVNDIHLNKDNGELVKSIFDQMVSVCKYYNITNIICGGDVFTNRSGQPLSCLLTFAECLDILKKEEILFLRTSFKPNFSQSSEIFFALSSAGIL